LSPTRENKLSIRQVIFWQKLFLKVLSKEEKSVKEDHKVKEKDQIKRFYFRFFFGVTFNFPAFIYVLNLDFFLGICLLPADAFFRFFGTFRFLPCRLAGLYFKINRPTTKRGRKNAKGNIMKERKS